MRPTWAEINLNSLKHNYLQVKKLVGNDVGIISIVKADAYGHGAVEVSRELTNLGSDYLGVATLEEGTELRESGIKSPIIILGANYGHQYKEIVHFNLTPSIFDLNTAKEFNSKSKQNGKILKCHIKLDTGMTRMGIREDELNRFLEEFNFMKNLEIEGVFTHLASAYLQPEEYTFIQRDLFSTLVSEIRRFNIDFKYLHCANSAAIQRYPELHLDLVRPGIMLYGSGPRFNKEIIIIKPVMKLKTHILQIKDVPPNTSISYGGTYITKKRSRIATLPIGYADGYMRKLSNKGKVLIKGSLVPIIGSVCMDLTIIDISGLDEVNVGDEVILFGDERIDVDDVANWADTISYEVLSVVGKRVPRKYIT